MSPDDLTYFRSPARWLGHPTIFKSETGSTNDDARALGLRGAAAGTLVLADAQTAGRGRRGRVWQSPPGANLYFSAVLRPRRPLSEVPSLTLATGLALCEAVAALVPPEHTPQIKWPNDLVVGGRKLAGILIEGSLTGPSLDFAIAGVGINVLGATLPAEVAHLATSMAQLSGDLALSRGALLGRILTRWEAHLETLEAHGFAALREAYRARCVTLGQRVRGDDFEGLAVDVEADGALRLEGDDGATRRVAFGEVLHVLSAPARL
ncbi:MAG: biotin--[acetyl-CoA-carboxylase] ligase [Myxococcales bacterium]|nr:biotin--[acetyl-CoA-carboxylase] ligase [Myxococcales bacterium]